MRESLADKFYQPIFKSKISQKGQMQDKLYPNQKFEAFYIFQNTGESFWPEDIKLLRVNGDELSCIFNYNN